MFVMMSTCTYPHRYKTSQELISHDTHNNTYQYKHTFSVEIVPVCKVKEGDPLYVLGSIIMNMNLSLPSSLQNDIVCLPLKLARSLGNIAQIVLCTRVTTALQLLDPSTLKGNQ